METASRLYDQNVCHCSWNLITYIMLKTKWISALQMLEKVLVCGSDGGLQKSCMHVCIGCKYSIYHEFDMYPSVKE